MNVSSIRPVLVVVLLAAACSTERPGDGEQVRPTISVPSPGYRDSLVITAPGGEQVWFTSGREAASAEGDTCVERTMQIRSARDTVAVPLLYTGQAPVLVDDSTIRADLWLNCRPGRSYLVHLGTGRPTMVDR